MFRLQNYGMVSDGIWYWTSYPKSCGTNLISICDDDQWRYSPDRALASLTGFMIVYSTMWVYQLHDRPILDTLIQPSETSNSNY
jgi:hypothetical protein